MENNELEVKAPGITERFYMGGRRWSPISREYFENVIVDFFGRPGGWWHFPMLYEQVGRFGLHITPKRHDNHNGFTRGSDNKFHPCTWSSNKLGQK